MARSSPAASGCLAVSGVLALLVVLPVVTYAAGMLLPRALIGTGTERLSGGDEEVAVAAYEAAHGDIFDGDSPDFLFVSALKVESARRVERCPSLEREARACGEACDMPPDKVMKSELNAEAPGAWEEYKERRELGPFVGRVRVYTLFGLPYDTVEVDCEGELATARLGALLDKAPNHVCV